MRITKWISIEDSRVTPFGQPLNDIASEMLPDARLTGFDCVFAQDGTKSWNGVTPLHIGWLVYAEN